jgi:hypothetical protein
VPRAPEGLALAVPAFGLLCVVPVIQALPMLVLVVVLVPALIAQVCGAVDALADALERGGTLASAAPAVPAPPAPPPAPVQAAPAAPPAPPPLAAPAQTQLSLLAAASLAFGLMGFCTGGLGGLIGMPMGLVAWLRIGRPENRLRGSGLAIAGMVVGVVALILGLAVLGLVVMALYPH